MNLRQDVRVRTDTGQEVAAALRLHRLQGRHRGLERARHRRCSATASIEATGLEVTDNGKVFHFRGRVRTVFESTGGPARRAAASPDGHRACDARATDKSPPMMTQIAFLRRAPRWLCRRRSPAPRPRPHQQGSRRPASAVSAPARSRSRSTPTGSTSSTRRAGRSFAGNVVAVQGDSTMKCTTADRVLRAERETRRREAGAPPPRPVRVGRQLDQEDRLQGPGHHRLEDAGRDRRQRHLRPRRQQGPPDRQRHPQRRAERHARRARSSTTSTPASPMWRPHRAGACRRCSCRAATLRRGRRGGRAGGGAKPSAAGDQLGAD